MTLTAISGTPIEAGQLAIKGTSGSLTSGLSIPITVVALPDFLIGLAPPSLTLIRGTKGSSAVTITPVNGFTGAVTITATGLPTGVTAAITALGSNSGYFLSTFSVAGTASVATSKITMTATSGSLTHSIVLTLAVVAPTAGTTLVDLSPGYNVTAGAVDYYAFNNGGLDGGGRSYSGVIMGGSLTFGGALLAFGPMGTSDAISGQTVALPAAKYSTLKMLATGLNGNQPAQTFTVTYSDGTKTTITQSLSDWFTPQHFAGESTAMSMMYRDNNNGSRDGEPFYLSGYSFALNNTKTVTSITLPANRNVVVLAMTLGN